MERRREVRNVLKLASVTYIFAILFKIQWNVMATFGNAFHFSREEVTVVFQCYRLGELLASRLVTAVFYIMMKCHTLKPMHHYTG